MTVIIEFMSTFSHVLEQLRDNQPTAKYGIAFEKLMVNYFRNDPTLSEEYSDVERFIDWIYYDGKSDTGIDLVARRREDDRWVAIQCKFYEPTAYLKRAILTPSSRNPVAPLPPKTAEIPSPSAS